MITKEELDKMTAEEVSKLFYKKQIGCKTCAEFVTMTCTDQEYIMIKERVIENLKNFIISRRWKTDNSPAAVIYVC